MIQIKQVREIPAGFFIHLDRYNTDMWNSMDNAMRVRLMNASKRIWIVYANGEPLFVVGLRITSFLGTNAEIWFMTCRGLSKNLIEAVGFMRRALRRTAKMYGSLMVNVDKDYPKGRRFVRYMGFEYTTEIACLDNRAYSQYELRAS